jgi:hypothetical protein
MGFYQKGLDTVILLLGSSVYKDFDRFLRILVAHPLDPALVIDADLDEYGLGRLKR